MHKIQQTSQIQKCRTICTHIKKLNKIQVTGILEDIAEIKCPTHNAEVKDSTICLHCNKVFCGQKSNQRCIFTHQKLVQGHIFSLNLQNGSLMCGQCDQNINFWCQTQSEQNQNEDSKKLKRFSQFIRQTYVRLKNIHEDLKHNIVSIDYRGLENLGNTCFLNSDLQVLNFSIKLVELYDQYKFSGNFSKSIISHRKSIPKQIEYFYDDVIEQGESKVWHVVTKKKDKIHEHNQKLIKTITSCKFNQLFHKLFQEMKNENFVDPFQPVQILDFLAHIDPKYSFKEQQDAEEALLFMIDILVQGQLTTMNYDMERYRKVQSLIGKQKISPTQRIFGTYLVSQIYCQNCKKINHTFDLTYHLSIDIETKTCTQNNSLKQHLSKQIETKQKVYYKKLKYPQNQHADIVLSQFLWKFFSEERLTHRQNFYSCSNCKSLVGFKKFYLVDLPQILIISIKRFNHKMLKNSKHLAFSEFIDLKDVALITLDEQGQTQKTNPKYKLYGVIVHLGETINNGHYVCYVKTNQNIWLRCSDHMVKKTTFKQVKQQQAYVLLYEKILEQE